MSNDAAQNPIEFLSPAEAEALSTPAVQACIARINPMLSKGLREFWVESPLACMVEAGLRSKGWIVKNQPSYGGMNRLDVASGGDVDPAVAEETGAALLAARR